jgi:2-oxoglutarate ferredoxin oxidoreductase subunit beta
MTHIHAHEARGEILTGLLYVRSDADDLHAHLKTVNEPLNKLAESHLCPGAAVLAALNAEMS